MDARDSDICVVILGDRFTHGRLAHKLEAYVFQDLLELQRAIGQLSNRKAAGKNGLQGEILDNGEPALEGALLQLVCSISEHEGSEQCTDSYRDISQLSWACKVLARILLNQLNATVSEANVPEEQCGFRLSRKKSRELNQPLYALFVDFNKAFNSVSHEAPWTMFGKFGCSGKFVTIVRLLHVGMKTKAQSCGSTSDDFDTVTGDSWEDGVEVEYWMNGRLLNVRRFGVTIHLQTSTMLMLLFADDSALLAHSEGKLQCLATAFASTASKFGGGAACVPPPQFRFAGDTVNSCGIFATRVEICRQASAAFRRLERRVWKNHSLMIATELCVYCTMVLYILLYGGETWTLYQRNVSYLIHFHVQCLRHILGIRWSDTIPNTEVLRRADMDGMEAKLVLNQLRWLGHVRRMDDDRIPRQLPYGQVKSGKRNPGGQRRRYQDVLRCWEDFTLNRTAWRNMVRAGVRKFNDQLLRGRERKRAKGINNKSETFVVLQKIRGRVKLRLDLDISLSVWPWRWLHVHPARYAGGGFSCSFTSGLWGRRCK
ncbi:uncharacterized protein DEA37_0008739 [Paragonimus westermani]|uniref:Reverse transcriptase domain-containing protein n=1 Tax=Paragonimus westermani TaxID=34504 RepID=A0A5J4N5E8_9TREM|nr:uncharacterized protein DEA37_0008739 [Paragonimus westermani]